MAACRLGGAWPRAMNIFEVALNDGLVPEPKKLGKETPRITNGDSTKSLRREPGNQFFSCEFLPQSSSCSTTL